MPRLRATPRPCDFQHPHDPIRLLAQAAQPKLRKELREAFRHLRTIVPVSSLAGAIRRGTPRQAAAALIDHWSEVLKGVFNRLGDIRFEAADLGARKITADFKRAGRRVRYRKAFNPDEPRDEHGKWTSIGDKLREVSVPGNRAPYDAIYSQISRMGSSDVIEIARTFTGQGDFKGKAGALAAIDAERIRRVQAAKEPSGFARNVISVAQSLENEQSFEGKVAIARVYDAYASRFSDAGSLESFKQRLVDAAKARQIRLARNDLPEYMDRRIRERSEAKWGDDTVHFLVKRVAVEPLGPLHKYNPDQPRDDHGRWEGSSRSEARRNLAEARAHANRLTERWRNMVRGEERRQEQRMRERMARDAPARAERRLLSSLPGAKFDGAGNLTNIEEMRAVRAERDRRRQANKSIDALFDELSSPTEPRERQFIKAIGDGFDFDRFDEDTIDALRQAQDDLIADLSDQARDTVAYLIDRGVQAGDSADEIATSIRDTIALTERQAQAVANYRSLLEGLDQQALERELRNAEFDEAVQAAIDSGEVLSDSMIDDMVAEYADNYLDYRADTIARTESLRSANEGLRDSYRQAADRGVFPAEAVTRFWRLDGKPCPICVQIWENNQDGVGLDEDFQSDDGPVDDAPVHGSCMCLIEYVTNLDMLPEEEGATEEDIAA